MGAGGGIGVFNPFAPTYCNTPLAQCYRRNEMEKKRAYDQRIREIEHGSFSPLVFSTTGGMEMTATVVYKRLASLIAEKYEKPYSKTTQWNWCRLSYSLLRSAIMCLHGSRSSRHNPAHHKIFGDTLTLPTHWAGSKPGLNTQLFMQFIYFVIKLTLAKRAILFFLS